jgi:putative endonuclease
VILYSLADRVRYLLRRGRWTSERLSGVRGEDLAHRFLGRQKFTIVARNYRPRIGSGEIDIIAWERDTLVFVEVKSRANDEFGTPDRAVTREKRKYLERAARDYARRAGIEWERVRFDIVTVLLSERPVLELIRDAFGSASKL